MHGPDAPSTPPATQNAPAARPRTYFLEDYTPGLVLEGGRYVVEAEEILEFGRRFDPQPMHTDPEAAAAGPFGSLIAPGCLTFCARNALYNQLPVRPALHAGLGLDELALPTPVRPGDVLSIRVEVVSNRVSKSRPGTGIVVTRQSVRNQAGEVALSMVAKMIVRARPADAEPVADPDADGDAGGYAGAAPASRD